MRTLVEHLNFALFQKVRGNDTTKKNKYLKGIVKSLKMFIMKL